jgi:RNA-binding protein 39
LCSCNASPDAQRSCSLRTRSARKRAEKREAEARQRELEELDRDTRTVFAYNVSTKADERDLFEFFTKAGTVLDVRIIYDRNTPRSKGMAYIEMKDRADVGAALALTGTTLRGQMVMVKASEAEKNIAWEAEKAQKAAGLPPGPMGQMQMQMQMGGPMPGMPNMMQQMQMGMGGMPLPPPTGLDALLGGAGPAKLRVSGLHPHLTEGDVRAVFEPFGALASCAMDASAAGEADVVYASARDAVQAAAQLNGMDLAGSALKVVLAAGAPPPPPLPPPPPMMGFPGGIPGFPGGFPAGMQLPPGMQLPAGMQLPPGMQMPEMPLPGGTAGELDDDGDGGLRLDSRSRAALMARLSGQDAPAAPAIINPLTGMPMAPGAAAAAAAGPAMPAALMPTVQGRLGPPSPIPTDCILLKNMFDPAGESEPDWWIDIGQDVKEECSKYGPVRHVFVDKESAGYVYLKFATPAAAAAARAALHTRWFAGRMIAAEFQFSAVYAQHFPESVGA